MKNTNKLRTFLSLFLCLALLLTACAMSQVDDTPTETQGTEETVSSTKQTEMPETEPTETEPASLEPDATALTEEEMAALELTLQDTQSWYPRFLIAASFTGLDDPDADLKLYSIFANGAPDEEAVQITDEEKQLLTEKYGGFAERDFYRLSRETVVNTLVSYLGLSQEDALAMALADTSIHYLEQTDSFYTTEMYNAMKASIVAAYYRDDGTISVYYWDTVYEGDPDTSAQNDTYYTHVAVLRSEGDSYVILSNQCVNS